MYQLAPFLLLCTQSVCFHALESVCIIPTVRVHLFAQISTHKQPTPYAQVFTTWEIIAECHLHIFLLMLVPLASFTLTRNGMHCSNTNDISVNQNAINTLKMSSVSMRTRDPVNNVVFAQILP